jgi:CRP-like cAMP-binding protein
VNNTIKDILEDPHFPEGTAWKQYHFKPEEIIINEGEEGRSLFYIDEGKMQVTGMVQLEENRHIHRGISDLEQGDIFGEVCLYKSQVRTATVRAITNGNLIEIDGESLNLYLDAHPIQGYLFLKDLFEILILRLDRANHSIGDLFSWGLKAHGIENPL